MEDEDFGIKLKNFINCAINERTTYGHSVSQEEADEFVAALETFIIKTIKEALREA